MEKYYSLIAESVLFRGIDKSEIPSLLQDLNAYVRSYKKDGFILHVGDIVHSLGLVLEGEVLVVQENFWAERSIVSNVHSGDYFAETFAASGNVPLGVSVLAKTNAKILFLSVGNIVNGCDKKGRMHQILLENLLMIIAKKNIAFTQKLMHLSQRSTREKILSYLSMESQKCHSPSFSIAFSRIQLAQYLMVDRSGLSVELNKLKKEGMIDFEGKHFILKKIEE